MELNLRSVNTVKNMENKKENICEVCGKPYLWKVRVKYENGEKKCFHDDDVPNSPLPDLTYQRICRSAKKGQVPVKGKDGVIRIME